MEDLTLEYRGKQITAARANDPPMWHVTIGGTALTKFPARPDDTEASGRGRVLAWLQANPDMLDRDQIVLGGGGALLHFSGTASSRARWVACACAQPLDPAHCANYREFPVSSHKVEQRRLSHRGREFHFVSYDAQIANERRGQPAVPAMWYLMIEGKRRPVLPHTPGQELGELDDALLKWVDEQVYGLVPVASSRQRLKS